MLRAKTDYEVLFGTRMRQSRLGFIVVLPTEPEGGKPKYRSMSPWYCCKNGTAVELRPNTSNLSCFFKRKRPRFMDEES